MKRVLFVDDEPMILAGLQNMLRKQRKVWDMAFVESGAKALEKLAEASFDVIVSDMRMPRMDGATLLKEVQRRYPNVVRIVLSGHAELDTALRSVSVAHQFLAKPCDASSLENLVDRACSLQALLGDDKIRTAIGTIGQLPSAPEIYIALTKALEDPDTSMKDLAHLIERDMAISAKVLQLVNSAFFGLPQRVASVQQALSYLGANMIRRVLLSVETFSMFEKEKVAGPFSLEALQAHSNVVAAVASKLMDDAVRSGDAFMAGMLHDVGKLILAVYVPDHFKRAMALGMERNVPLHVAEQELFGVTHAEIGGYLLGIWGLPYAIVEAVAHHHSPGRVEHATFDVLDAVYVAEALVSEASKRAEAPSAPSHLDSAYIEVFGLESKLPAWREMVSEVMSSMGAG
ncbi:MAG TPA: response regulator [Polyangiaceae bacterium]|nr:response regulator [Polyangiaceae bacterium]